MRRHGRRLGTAAACAVLLAVAGTVLTAAPAVADTPTPGDYTSEITAIEPATDGFRLEVAGGDSFLELTVDQGTEVVVVGYQEEPFLRVGADGTVERNLNSPATYLNDDRYAAVTLPERLSGVDASSLDPEWETVATSGEYAWHDHRIHWMAPNAPPAVDRGTSFDWSGPVELIVDGARVEVRGTINYRRAISPLPWLAGAGVVTLLATVGLRGRLRLASTATAAVGIAAAAMAWATLAAAPAGIALSPLPTIGGGVAAVIGIASIALADRQRPLALLAAASVLGPWGLLRWAVLTNPVLPTSAPFWLDRAITAAAIGIAIALAITAFPAISRQGRTAPG